MPLGVIAGASVPRSSPKTTAYVVVGQGSSTDCTARSNRDLPNCHMQKQGKVDNKKGTSSYREGQATSEARASCTTRKGESNKGEDLHCET